MSNMLLYKIYIVLAFYAHTYGFTFNYTEDEQICELKKRLQVTEDAMERILKQIGSLSQMLEAKGLLMSEVRYEIAVLRHG